MERAALKKDPLTSPIFWAVFVAALGYFVDAYDIILFTILRTKSLQDIGVPHDQIFSTGVDLLNWQLTGLLLGGIFWGILGDKKGRLSVLFGSIFLYSISNILNGFVHSVETYRVLRFFTGLGLAGELGGGITLVSEIMSRTGRGWGTMIVASTGVTGVVAAALVGQLFPWQTAFFVGGGMGLGLLFLRLGVKESAMFKSLGNQAHRGDFFSFFRSKKQFLKYLYPILVGMPVWYAVGILLTFCPEIGAAMGLTQAPNPGQAVLYAYAGLTTGDVLSGSLSQWMRSRKKVIFGALILSSAIITLFFFKGGASLPIFYGFFTAIGFSMGFWAVFLVVTAEQFGTNLRATATTTIPNFVRGSAILLTTAFKWLMPACGTVGAAALVGLVTMGLALWGLQNLEETYGKNLDYTEPA